MRPTSTQSAFLAFPRGSRTHRLLWEAEAQQRARPGCSSSTSQGFLVAPGAALDESGWHGGLAWGFFTNATSSGEQGVSPVTPQVRFLQTQETEEKKPQPEVQEVIQVMPGLDIKLLSEIKNQSLPNCF